jgi:hypothetical protein
MADRDEHPRDVRHAGLPGDGEIAALVGHGHLCGAGEFGLAGQLGFCPALAFAAVRALRSTIRTPSA